MDTRLLGGMQQCCQRKNPKIMQRHDRGDAGITAGIENRRTQQRKKIMNVNNIRPELRDFSGQHAPSSRAVNGLQSRRDPCAKSIYRVVAHAKQFGFDAVLLEHRQLFANDAVLASWHLIKIVND